MPDNKPRVPGLVLVIGATGGAGGETAKAFRKAGWRVRALHRDPDAARVKAAWVGPVQWVAGDAMSETDMVAAAQGADVIVHAANPPNYRNWRGLAVPMLANAIAAARASGARLVLTGNVYNFGPDAGPLVGEDAPQHPSTRKGAVRVEMEEMLARAAEAGVRSLVLRAGDFFGPHHAASWFSSVMVKPGRPVRSVTYPGREGIGHAWAYLPDLAATIVQLSRIEQRLADCEVIHFGGHWLEDGMEMTRAIKRVTNMPDLPVRRMPWFVVRLAAPFVPFLREVAEMRYLWQVPLRLDNAKLLSLLEREPHTPLDEAVGDTLAGLGCVEGPDALAVAA